MTLPTSGPISMSEVNVELGLSSMVTISLNDAIVRGLFGIPSGTISLADGLGVSNVWEIDKGTTAYSNLNLRTLADSSGYTTDKKKVLMRFAGVISATATGTPAMEFGSWPDDVEVQVELYGSCVVRGKGGSGGAGSTGTATPKGGGAGGAAIKVSTATKIGSAIILVNSTVRVYGGGGGGGGGGGNNYTKGSGLDSYNTTSSGGKGGNGYGPSSATGGAAGGKKAGAGGKGGGAGAAGSKGGTGYKSGGSGGAGGAAISGSSKILLVGWNTGTYSGAIA